jgi:hypothetical protein
MENSIYQFKYTSNEYLDAPYLNVGWSASTMRFVF